MAFKPYAICAVTIFIKTTVAQYVVNAAGTGGVSGLGWPNSGLAGLGTSGPNNLSHGGGLVVTSSSPIAPTGLSVFAENLRMEGPLAVEGSLPLSGTVALEGQVPTAGMAGTKYGCGNGKIGIESLTGAGAAGGFGYGGGQAGGLAYGGGQAGGLAYGTGQAGGLGYSSLAGVGQAGVGASGLRVY